MLGCISPPWIRREPIHGGSLQPSMAVDDPGRGNTTQHPDRGAYNRLGLATLLRANADLISLLRQITIKGGAVAALLPFRTVRATDGVSEPPWMGSRRVQKGSKDVAVPATEALIRVLKNQVFSQFF